MKMVFVSSEIICAKKIRIEFEIFDWKHGNEEVPTTDISLGIDLHRWSYHSLWTKK